MSYVLSYCLPIEIMTLIRKRLLAPELGKVAYAYRNAGHACALKGAWNSAGQTVHEALVEQHVTRDELLVVIKALYLSRPTGDSTLIEKWSQYLLYSHFSHRAGHAFLDGLVDIKSGDSKCLPYAGKSPVYQRYKKILYKRLADCTEAHWVCEGTRADRVSLEVLFSWIVRDTVAEHGYGHSVQTGEEGFLGPPANAEKAVSAVLEEVLKTDVFQEIFTEEQSQRVGRSAWHHRSALQHAPFTRPEDLRARGNSYPNYHLAPSPFDTHAHARTHIAVAPHRKRLFSYHSYCSWSTHLSLTSHHLSPLTTSTRTPPRHLSPSRPLARHVTTSPTPLVPRHLTSPNLTLNRLAARSA